MDKITCPLLTNNLDVNGFSDVEAKVEGDKIRVSYKIQPLMPVIDPHDFGMDSKTFYNQMLGIPYEEDTRKTEDD